MDRKHELLDEFQSIVHIDNREALWRLVNRGRWVEPRASDYADRLDRHWDNVANVVLQPPIEQCDSARSLMLAWVAKQCGKQRAFESTGRLIMSTRESLTRYLPNKRIALRRRLYFLRNLVVEPAWWQDLIGKLPGTRLKPAPELAPRTTSGTVAVSLARGTERILNLDRIGLQYGDRTYVASCSASRHSRRATGPGAVTNTPRLVQRRFHR